MEGKSSSEQLKRLLESNEGKVFSLVGLTVVTVVLLLFFTVRPALLSISNKIEDNKRKEDYLEASSEKLTNLLGLEGYYQEHTEGIDNFNDNFFPIIPNDAFMGRNIIDSAQSNNLEIQNLSVEKPDLLSSVSFLERGVTGGEMSFTISLKGEIRDIESFVTTLERYPRIVNIDNVSYSRLKSEGSENFNGTVTGYYYIWSL